MEGRLLFAPDPFIKQRWYGFKSGYCILKGSFLNFTEKSTFLPLKTEEYSIPLESCLVNSVPHPKKHLFEVVTSSGSKFNFIASSRREADEWINKIREKGSASNSSSSNVRSCQQFQPSSSIQSCSSFMTRKKFHSSSKARDGHRSNRKGRIIADGLKRYGSMILSGAFTGSGTFGVPLQFCKPSPIVKHVPNIVVVCTEIIEERGLDHQGVYRVPGNTTHVNSLYHELMVSSEVVIQENDERWRDVNVIGSLLKLFFRKLPGPIITTELYAAAMEAIRKPSEEGKLRSIVEVLKSLPKHHHETFRHLARHLHRVSCREKTNKMNAHNLSIVFGPTLICPRDENETSRMVVDMSDQCLIVEVIVKNVDVVFGNDRKYDSIDDDDVTMEERQGISPLDMSFSDDEELFVSPARAEIGVILESHREEEEDDGLLAGEGGSAPAEPSNRLLSAVANGNSKASNHSYDGQSPSNSAANCTPVSSRGQSPFRDRQETECDWASEAGNRNNKATSLRGWRQTQEKDVTEQALLQLKRLSLDLRTFKHRLEIEKMEQLHRNVSKERIEREYERTLGEFGIPSGELEAEN